MNRLQLLCGISVLLLSSVIIVSEDVIQDTTEQLEEDSINEQVTSDALDEEAGDVLSSENNQPDKLNVDKQALDKDDEIEFRSIDQLDIDEDVQIQTEDVTQEIEEPVIKDAQEVDSVAVSSDNEEVIVPETAVETEESDVSTVQEERKEDVSLELSEPLGIDTMDLSEPQGNWLFKRVWWERAEERYEKINQLVQKMMEMRVNFFVKRADIDKTILDPFYLNIGMGHAELLVTITTLIEQVEKERQEEGVLTYDQRELLETLQLERDAVVTLQKDAEAIQELDHSVDEALAKLIEIMNEMRQHERNAWVNFKEIARVLSEKKARELFYNIDASWQHIKKLRDYLEKDFGPYFAKLAKSVSEHVEVVQKQIDTLQEKGISLKQSVDILTKEKEVFSYNYDDEDDEYDEPVQTSWFAWIGNFFWSIVLSPITLFEMIFG